MSEHRGVTPICVCINKHKHKFILTCTEQVPSKNGTKGGGTKSGLGKWGGDGEGGGRLCADCKFVIQGNNALHYVGLQCCILSRIGLLHCITDNLLLSRIEVI